MISDFKDKENNFEQCMKCSVCSAYCPVTLVNPNFSGPKQSGPDGERYRLRDLNYFDKTLEYCLNCKRCEVVCPSGVTIADIIQVAKVRHAAAPPSLRNRLISGTDAVGRIGNMISPVINTAFKTPVVKKILDKTLKIDSRRELPYYSHKRFRTLFRRKALQNQDSFKNKVAYFHGCYVDFNNPKLGMDLIKILNAVGLGVELFDEKCCGMPYLMNGLIDKARHNAGYNIKEIQKLVDTGRHILTTSSTCTLTLRNEYDNILGLDNKGIKESILLASRYLLDMVEEGKIILKFKATKPTRLAYHASCHIEKLGWAIYSAKLTALIPGYKTIMLDSACCGLAGTHGYKKELYEDSQRIGSVLFNKIKKVNPDLIASDCESCKRQIEMSTGYKVEHPISLIADTLDITATRKANGL